MLLCFLYKIWSLVPLFSITRDSNFGYNKDANKAGVRFSVLNIMLGDTTHYFITFIRKDAKITFSIYSKLSLSNCQWKLNGEGTFSERDTYFNRIADDYIETHVKNLPDDEKDIEKEFLLYLQESISRRKSLSYDKMNYYTAIILVFLPLSLTFFKSIFTADICNNTLLLFVSCIVGGLFIYMLINWCLLALQYISVSGVNKSSFKALKEPPQDRSRIHQLIYSFYYDWQEERFDADLRVAYVATIEAFVKWAVLFLIILMLLPITAKYFNKAQDYSRPNDINTVFTTNITNLDTPFSPDSLTLSEIHVKIKSEQPQKLIVLVNENTNTMDTINENFGQYKDYIDIIILIDSHIPVDKFKVIILGG